MYLENLSIDVKPLFMELILSAAMANGMIDDKQEKLIKKYCKEMDYPDSGRRTTDQNVDDICKKLNAVSNEKERKIIVFELVYLVNSDRYIDMKESSFLREVSYALDMKDNFVENAVILMDKYKDIQDLMDRLVLGKREFEA